MVDFSTIPLTPARRSDNLVHISGQLGFVGPGRLIEGGIAAQTRQTLENIRTILRKAGGDLGDVVKTTVWLTDKSNFSPFNEAYAAVFDGCELPARSTVVTGLLIDGALVEIEALAHLPLAAPPSLPAGSDDPAA
ncbi:RidA family protein [Sphingomonas sp.]|uniref:RidA family protein n=1 Tax=Sphingomonas sp. TaxID=28214 RepID=UPI001B05F1AE|nr:RidA family protein [Sphingomonas sp.]MBO9714547.1 RidA family protein [Sphingomonas sp.]